MKRFVKPESNASKTLILIAIAAVMMVALDAANTYISSLQNKGAVTSVQRTEKSNAEFMTDIQTAYINLPTDTAELPQPEAKENTFPEEKSPEVADTVEPTAAKEPTPPPKKPVKKATAEPPIKYDTSRPAKVAIIIDDLGMNRIQSHKMINIGAPLTLAFLPYAPGVSEMAKEASLKNHELIIHMPMEPLDGKISTGPIALKDHMGPEDVSAQLTKAFDSFDGYVGLNNHMGSRVTQNEAILRQVMGALKSRDLFFVDSKTTPKSIASDIARETGLKYADRDIFLDHHTDLASVQKSLRALERKARQQGSAIGIGHPKAVTVQALKQWLPTLKEKNIQLVPVATLMRQSAPTHVATKTLDNTALEEVSDKALKIDLQPLKAYVPSSHQPGQPAQQPFGPPSQ